MNDTFVVCHDCNLYLEDPDLAADNIAYHYDDDLEAGRRFVDVEAGVAELMEWLGPDNDLCWDKSKDNEFSNQRCFSCGSTLAGHRFYYEAWPR